MFGTKHSKTNWLQKIIKYQTNEQITKYSNWNMEIQNEMLGNTKHNQVKLVLKVFVSAYFYQYSIILSNSISK